jgi:NTE family protein
MSRLYSLESQRIGLALSGGGLRGIAHIGVLKVLAECEIRPSVVAGTSIGSIIGAGIAAGMSWQELAAMARKVFWPSLLHGSALERFCARQFPVNFADLSLPFVATATAVPAKQTVVLRTGRLAPAISASCAVHLRRPVVIAGKRLKDGGFSCVLPSRVCRDLGAGFVIASDVWEFSAMFRGIGITHRHRLAERVYPPHYMRAVQSSDLLIQPAIPLSSYVLLPGFVDRLIASGEAAARRTLESDACAPPSVKPGNVFYNKQSQPDVGA